MSLSKKVADQKKSEKEEHKIKLEKTWIKNLESSDEKVVSGALKNIAKNGTIRSADALLKLLISDNQSSEIQGQLMDLLKSVKNPEMLDVIMQWLDDERANSFKSFLVSCIWEAGFDAAAHFESLAYHGIRGDYMTLLEVLTVIENLEGSIPEGQIINVNLIIDEVLEEGQTDKTDLLLSLKEVIQNLG
jgi:hypothetical protein